MVAVKIISFLPLLGVGQDRVLSSQTWENGVMEARAGHTRELETFGTNYAYI
jgi:hypothetical protein